MRRHLFLFVPSLVLAAMAATLHVEVRDSEVWLMRDGQPKQLTRDGKSKLQAMLAPAEDRVAYYEVCPQPGNCTASVVILDLEGRRLRSFPPAAPDGPCGSILNITWVGGEKIGVECHINPSLNEYMETDVSTGKRTRDLLGYDFTRSPDGKQVAHVGWIMHFAPPYAQSNYLQVENTTIYPLPQGTRPVVQRGLSEPPQVVAARGLTYSGIHKFRSGLSWSPDSKRIALIDCTYDWTANSGSSTAAADGKESNRLCAAAVVSLRGEAALFPFPDVATQSKLSWTGPRRLLVQTENFSKTIVVQ